MREPNQTIGFVVCPICGDKAQVRKQKNNKLYYLGKAGKITPNYRDGQEWLEKNTQFIDAPQEAPKPVNEIKPVNETLKPVNDHKPVNEKPKRSALDRFIYGE